MSTVLGIDLAALTLKDALDMAILIEEEARERYEDLTGQMELHHTPEAARFFRFMSANEEKHRAELAGRRNQLFGSEPTRVNRGMFFEVEAPEFDEVRVFMSAREALQVAFRAENRARSFFAEAAEQILDLQVRALFTELRDEEVNHQKLVLAELEKTRPESALRHRDVADEPVAQSRNRAGGLVQDS